MQEDDPNESQSRFYLSKLNKGYENNLIMSGCRYNVYGIPEKNKKE